MKIIVPGSKNTIGQDLGEPFLVCLTNVGTYLLYRLCKQDPILERSSSSSKTILRCISISHADATSFDLQHKD